MNPRQVKKNLILYYLFQLFREPLFWGPILIFYIQQVSGMSLSSIYAMEAVVVVLLVILEVPTGALADLIGRKKTIFLGSLLLMADNFLFAAAFNPLMIWAADIIWAIGFSLISGADSSLLYDTLKAAGQTEKFKRIQGRSIGFRLFLVALTSLMVGHLAEVHIRLPLFLCLPFMAVTCLITYLFIEPQRSQNHYGLKRHWDLMKLSVLFVTNNQKVKWIIGYVVLIGVASKIWFFTYNPYFELVGLPLKYFGYLFFGMNLIAALFSFFADQISQKFSDFISSVLMVVLLGAPIVLMATIVALPSVLLVLVQNIVRGYLKPFTDHFLHDRLNSENRATVMSIKSAVNGLGQFVFLGLFGIVLKAFSLANSLLALGLAVLVVGGYLLIRYQKVFRPTG